MKSLFGALILALSTAALAQPLQLKSDLSGVAFLAGSWTGGNGKVAETGGTSRGSSVITAEVGGGILLRRDHTDLFDRAGKPAGGFNQLMTIYPEAGTIRGEYFDGVHTIHYGPATVVPGRSVTFVSTSMPGAPVFRLTYELTTPTTLMVVFAMASPGQKSYRPIASGTLHKGG